MPEYLRIFGNHYEVWQLNGGHLCINVKHTNQGELGRQQHYTPQQWWDRYNHQEPHNATRAIRHAGNLVRAYSTELQADQVRFCFVALGQPGCQAQAPEGPAPQNSATPPREIPAQNEAVQPTHPDLTPGAGSMRVPKPSGEKHDFDKEAFQRWLQRHFALSKLQAIPLFKTNDLRVQVNGNGVPFRHPKMEQFYRGLIEDVRNGSVFCGIVYGMYWVRDERVVPLYIGKTERYGRNGGLSANLNTSESGPFGRWGYSNDYHMGNLGIGLRAGRKYQNWIERLFDSPTDLRLRSETFFGATVWTHNDQCSCGEHTNVAALEKCLIRHARRFWPEDNLNKKDGKPACRCPS